MPKRIDWPRWDHLLGVKRDVEIAKKIECFPGSVGHRRAKLGIPSVDPKRKVDWSKWDHLIGVETDTEIARKAGCDQATVWHRRKKLGIKISNVYFVDWAQWDHVLGKKPDCEIARQIGCTQPTVLYRRHKLGIAPSKNARIDWSKWDHLIGSKTDKEVAELIRCGEAAVASRRRKLGVSPPQMRGWNKVSCSVEVVAPTPIELTPKMQEALEGLSPRIRDILVRRFGIGRGRETLENIGKEHGVTRERIRQLEREGLLQLRFQVKEPSE